MQSPANVTEPDVLWATAKFLDRRFSAGLLYRSDCLRGPPTFVSPPFFVPVLETLLSKPGWTIRRRLARGEPKEHSRCGEVRAGRH